MYVCVIYMYIYTYIYMCVCFCVYIQFVQSNLSTWLVCRINLSNQLVCQINLSNQQCQSTCRIATALGKVFAMFFDHSSWVEERTHNPLDDHKKGLFSKHFLENWSFFRLVPGCTELAVGQADLAPCTRVCHPCHVVMKRLTRKLKPAFRRVGINRAGVGRRCKAILFFFAWVVNNQLNHWTKQVVSTRLIRTEEIVLDRFLPRCEASGKKLSFSRGLRRPSAIAGLSVGVVNSRLTTWDPTQSSKFVY